MAETLIRLLPPILGCVLGVTLIVKPKPFAYIIGTFYWHLARFTPIGKTEETKKYFLSENTILFRIIGLILFLIGSLGIVARMN